MQKAELGRVGRVMTQQAETRCEAALGAATCGQKKTKESGMVAAATAGRKGCWRGTM
jgi:hypothetical protein